MALKGSLANNNIVDIVSLLRSYNRTGLLDLEDGERRIELTFFKGLVVQAFGHESARPDLLTYLVRQNELSDIQAEEIRKATASSGFSVIEMLLLEGNYSKELLLKYENERLLDTLFAVFTWIEGIYSFQTKRENDVQFTQELVIDPSAYIKQGYSMFERTIALAKSLPPVEHVVTVNKSSPSNELSQQAQELLKTIKDSTFVAAILQSPQINRLPIYESLDELLRTGCVTAASPEQSLLPEVLNTPQREWNANLLFDSSKNFVRIFTRCVVSYALYPAYHPVIQRLLTQLLEIINTLQSGDHKFSFRHFEGRLFVDSNGLPYPNDQFDTFIELLKQRLIRSITFLPGLDADELARFIVLMTLRHEEIKNQGGIQSLLKRKGIVRILIEEMSDGFVDSAVEAGVAGYNQIRDVLRNKFEDNNLLKLIAESPEKIAEYIQSQANSSDPPTLGEIELRNEMVKNSLEHLFTELGKQNNTGEQRDSLRLVQSVFERLDEEVKAGIILSKIPIQSDLGTVISSYTARLPIDKRVELFCSYYQVMREIRNREGIAMGNFLQHMRTSFENLVANSMLDQSQGKKILGDLVRGRLFEMGVPLREIDYILNTQSIPSSRAIKLTEHLRDSDPLLILHKECLDETVDVIRELCKSQEDGLLNQVISPYKVTLSAESWQTRQMAADALRAIADELTQNNKNRQLEEVIQEFSKQLKVEEMMEVYMSLARAMESIAITLRTKHLERVASRITSAFVSELDQQSNKSPMLQRVIIQSLGHIGDEKTANALVKKLDDKFLNEESAKSLSHMGEKIIQPLIELLGIADKRSVRFRICHILEDMGEPAIPYLKRALRSNSWYLRRNACMVLRKIGNTSVIDAVGALIVDNVFQVRREAVTTLGSLGGTESEKYIIKALKDPNLVIKRLAATHLGRIGGPVAVKVLISVIDRRIPFMKPEDDDLRTDVCDALARLGDRRAVGALSRILREIYLFPREKKTQVSIAAIHALATLGGPKAKRAVMKATQSKNQQIRRAAVESLVLLDRTIWDNPQ